jgi:hypothetical protein
MEIRSRERVTFRLPEKKQEYLFQLNERVCIGAYGGSPFPARYSRGELLEIGKPSGPSAKPSSRNAKCRAS